MAKFFFFFSFFLLELVLELGFSFALNSFVHNNYFEKSEIINNLLYVAIIKLPFLLILNSIIVSFVYYDILNVKNRAMLYFGGLLVIQFFLSVIIFKDKFLNLSFLKDPTYGVEERLFLFSILIFIFFYLINKKLLINTKV